ncbi:hypothetical protein EON66_01100 [archaeon]|nr:MAG: hypothetical protein EON66_01100 [archaeon]
MRACGALSLLADALHAWPQAGNSSSSIISIVWPRINTPPRNDAGACYRRCCLACPTSSVKSAVTARCAARTSSVSAAHRTRCNNAATATTPGSCRRCALYAGCCN